jgi:peptidoglycan L-alanyl-D-glutamate endopeptidase CwlK
MNPLSIASKLGRGGLLASFIATSLLSSAPSVAFAEAKKTEYGLSEAAYERLSVLRKDALIKGIKFRVTQGYRSQAEQDAKYAQGRTKPGKIVTWTKTSRHTSRNAFDIAVETDKGITWDPKAYSEIGKIGKSAGLRWGGDFAGRDMVHFEIPKKGYVIPAGRMGDVRKTTDYIAGLTEASKESAKNVSDMLYETAVHESGGLRYSQQVWGQGKATSIFQIEPSTAEHLVSWSMRHKRALNILVATSGKTEKQLKSMSRNEISKLVSSNEKFAAAMARVKYLTAPGAIPGSLNDRAAYWSKYYQGTSNPEKTKQFIEQNKKAAADLSGASVSNVVSKHVNKPPQNHGLVDKIHQSKVSHNISSQKKKLSIMSKILHSVR